MPKVNFIKKDVLLDILYKNLKLHKSIYQKTYEAFKKNYFKEIEELKKKATKNKFEFHIEVMKPENHEKDYINSIKMVLMNCHDEVQLSEEEFLKYVLNQWNWLHTFCLSYYSNASSSSSSGPSKSSSSISLTEEEKGYFDIDEDET